MNTIVCRKQASAVPTRFAEVSSALRLPARRLFVGSLDTSSRGYECTESEDCDTDLICNKDLDKGVSLVAASSPEGERCSEDAACASGPRYLVAQVRAAS
jgi:hypothetical protein